MTTAEPESKRILSDQTPSDGHKLIVIEFPSGNELVRVTCPEDRLMTIGADIMKLTG